MGNRLDHLSQRLVYEKAKGVLQQAGVSVQGAKLTMSSLRFEQQLNTTQNNYTFGVTVVDNGPSGTKFNTEIRLNQQDSFVCTELALYLAEPASVADATFVDCTYPSPAVFANTGEAAALGVIYHGFLKLTVNNDVILPSLYTSRFRRVQASQKVTAAANQNGIANDSTNMVSDGMLIMEPNLYFVGSKNNLLQLVLPAAVSVVGASAFTRVILEAKGILAQNSTIIT